MLVFDPLFIETTSVDHAVIGHGESCDGKPAD